MTFLEILPTVLTFVKNWA